MPVAAHSSCGRADPQSPRVIDALRAFAPQLYAQQRVDFGTRIALDQILRCRTPALKGHRYTCEDCGSSTVLHDSCGSRYCPQCQGRRRREWLERTQALMLPTPHFQVVFTLPAELRPLARADPRTIYALLFDAASHVLQTLARQHMGARLSILAVLHTWDRQLRLHPHVHCVVSAGGLCDDGTWTDTRPGFLFPHRVMQKMFQGRFLSRLDKALKPRLSDRYRRALKRLRKRLFRKRWVVHVEAPDERATGFLLKYLARYVYQTAISNSRIVAIGDDRVTLRTRGKATATIPGLEFVRRFTLHFLPYRFRKIRPYGLLAPSNRPRLTQAKALLPAQPPASASVERQQEANDAQDVEEGGERDVLRCPECGGRIGLTPLPADPEWDPCTPWAPQARGPP